MTNQRISSCAPSKVPSGFVLLGSLMWVSPHARVPQVKTDDAFVPPRRILSEPAARGSSSVPRKALTDTAEQRYRRLLSKKMMQRASFHDREREANNDLWCLRVDAVRAQVPGQRVCLEGARDPQKGWGRGPLCRALVRRYAERPCVPDRTGKMCRFDQLLPELRGQSSPECCYKTLPIVRAQSGARDPEGRGPGSPAAGGAECAPRPC